METHVEIQGITHTETHVETSGEVHKNIEKHTDNRNTYGNRHAQKPWKFTQKHT